MERELMRFCMTSAGKKKSGSDQDDKLDSSAMPNNTLKAAEEMLPIEADWDSDDD
jgi:hypothetical protein